MNSEEKVLLKLDEYHASTDETPNDTLTALGFDRDERLAFARLIAKAMFTDDPWMVVQLGFALGRMYERKFPPIKEDKLCQT